MADMEIKIPIEVRGDKEGKSLGKSIAESFHEKTKSLMGSLGFGGSSGGARASSGASGIGSKVAGFGKLLAGIGLVIGGIMLVGGLLKKGLAFAQSNPVVKGILNILRLIIFLLFLPLVPILLPVLKALGAAAKKAAKTVGGVTSGELDMGQWMSDLLGSVGDGLVQAFTTLMEFIAKIWVLVKDPFLKMLRIVMSDVIPVLIEIFITTLPDAFKALYEGLELSAESIIERFGKTTSAWIGVGLIIAAIAMIILAVVTAGGSLVVGAIVATVAALIAIVIVFWEQIKGFFVYLYELDQQFRQWMWNVMKKVSEMIWNGLKDIGSWIANAVRSAVNYVVSLFTRREKSESKRANDFILRPGGQIIETSPDDTLIAIKKPEKLFGKMGGGSIIVNINHPMVRDDSDIKKLADQVSQVLQRQTNRRFSVR